MRSLADARFCPLAGSFHEALVVSQRNYGHTHTPGAESEQHSCLRMGTQLAEAHRGRASGSLGEPLCKKLQSLGDPLSLKQRLDALKNFQINHVNLIML